MCGSTGSVIASEMMITPTNLLIELDGYLGRMMLEFLWGDMKKVTTRPTCLVLQIEEQFRDLTYVAAGEVKRSMSISRCGGDHGEAFLIKCNVQSHKSVEQLVTRFLGLLDLVTVVLHARGLKLSLEI